MRFHRSYSRSISHDTALLSGSALVGSSKTNRPASPTDVVDPFANPCGWNHCKAPAHHHDLVIIAHDARVQALMDKLEIAWGTQFEIARGVSSGKWSWEDVTEDLLQKLRGTNADSAPRVHPVIQGAATAPAAAYSRM